MKRPRNFNLHRCGLGVAILFGTMTLAVTTGGAQAPAAQIPPEVLAYADLILTNGKVLTVDRDFNIREALAIRDGRVLAVGTTAVIQRYAGPKTRRIDLAGRTVIPGIIDTHLHLHEGAPDRFYKDFITNEPKFREYLDTATIEGSTVPEILAGISKVAASRRPSSWINIEIANESMRKPFVDTVKLADLDKAAPNNPILIGTVGWLNMVNTKTMEEMRKYYGYLPEDLEKTAIADVAAVRGITGDLLIDHPMQSLYGAFKKEMERYATFGVTTYSSSMTPVTFLSVFREMDRKGDMPIRFAFSQTVGVTSFPHAAAFYQRLGDITGLGTEYLWAAGAGVTVADGPPEEACSTLGQATPCFIAALEGEKRKALFASVKAGNRVTGTHVSGDKAADQLMDVIEEASAAAGMTLEQIRAKTHTLDHCRMYPRPDQIDRAKRLNIMWNCAPNSLENNAEMVARKFGQEYAHRWVVPVGSILRAGGRVTGHGEGVRGASYFTYPELLMTRTDSRGRVWGKDQAIDRKDVLRMYTIWAAEYVARSDRLGSLEPGKLADLVVLDRDYMAIPETDFSEIRALMTLVGGKTVFQAPTFKTQ
jgi:predicted amidohydrolase YtcJ